MDKAYEGNPTRKCVVDSGMIPVVPPKKGRLDPWAYDEELYKQRNEVERFFCRLKRFRRINTRYEKLDQTYLTMIHLALNYDALVNCVNTP